MNLAQLLKLLIENKVLSIEDAISFLISVIKDNPEEKPNLPISLSKFREPSQSLLNQLQLQCTLCERCNYRKQAVVADAGRNPTHFVIGYCPDLLSDKTGIPLSSSMELKSSLCVKCKNFGLCYDSNFSRNETFSLDSDKDKVLQRIKSINPDNLNYPGKVISTLLISGKKDPQMFKGVRESWQSLFDIVSPSTEKRHSWDIPSKLYITYLVKCYSPESPTEKDIKICKRWLLLERNISPAKFTVILGRQVFSNIFPDRNFEDSLSLRFEDDTFKTVITTYSPEEIIGCSDFELSHKMSKHLLDSLFYSSSCKISSEESEDFS